MRILVTGGTGELGRSLVLTARSEGHRARIMSRRPRTDGASVDGRQAEDRPPTDAEGGVRPGPVEQVEWVQADLATGEKLDVAVRDADAIIHAATDPARASVIDVPGTRRLVSAATDAGVGHLVYVSIVGIDRIPIAYYKAKLAAEEVVRDGGVPWSILRITQFHAFVDQLLVRMLRVPWMLPVPAGVSVQSIATQDAARALVALAGGPPQGRVPDLAGPEVLPLSAAARSWVRARRVRRLVVPVPIPGAAGRALRRGYNTVPEHPGGGETWAAWLGRTGDTPSAR